jgi:hypothetical protein
MICPATDAVAQKARRKLDINGAFADIIEIMICSDDDNFAAYVKPCGENLTINNSATYLLT